MLPLEGPIGEKLTEERNGCSLWQSSETCQYNAWIILRTFIVKPEGAYSHHQALRVKARERIPTVCGDDSAHPFPLPAYCCISLQSPLACTKNPKDVLLVCYQTIIFTNTPVNRKARWLEGNTGNRAGGGCRGK
jgi:hypothetical protein